MPLIVVNKLGEDGRGRDHEFKIVTNEFKIEHKVQNVNIVTNENQQIMRM